MLKRYGELLPGLDELRTRGVPVPRFIRILAFEGDTLSVQQRLPGQAENNPSPLIVEEMADHIAAKAGIKGLKPAPDQPDWGDLSHPHPDDRSNGLGGARARRRFNAQTAALLERVKGIGTAADPSGFPDSGLVHLDLNTDKVLIDDSGVSGLIDWEGACAGNHRYDLVQYAFDLHEHGHRDGTSSMLSIWTCGVTRLPHSLGAEMHLLCNLPPPRRHPTPAETGRDRLRTLRGLKASTIKRYRPTRTPNQTMRGAPWGRGWFQRTTKGARSW